MNHQQSTSISGKHHPENHKGEGSTPCVSQQSCIQFSGNRFEWSDSEVRKRSRHVQIRTSESKDHWQLYDSSAVLNLKLL
jgi:hypothetical protein